MTKITNPLFSVSASGSIGGTFSFRQTASGAVCTTKPKKYKQNSPAQAANQQRMRDAVTAFRALSATDRKHWNTLAAKYRRSAFACFFAEYQYQVIHAPNAPLIPEPNL